MALNQLIFLHVHLYILVSFLMEETGREKRGMQKQSFSVAPAR